MSGDQCLRFVLVLRLCTIIDWTFTGVCDGHRFSIFNFGSLKLCYRILSIVYLHHGNVDEFLQKNTQENPLDDIKPLGLQLGM